MSEREKKIQEMQFLEQNLQNSLMQKQAFDIELAETKSALKEIEKAGDEVFKIIGQLMIKTEKDKMQKELADKEKMLTLRIKAFEKQENSITKQMDKLREEVMSKKE